MFTSNSEVLVIAMRVSELTKQECRKMRSECFGRNLKICSMGELKQTSTLYTDKTTIEQKFV